MNAVGDKKEKFYFKTGDFLGIKYGVSVQILGNS